MNGSIHCIVGPMACNDGPNGYGKTGTLLHYLKDSPDPLFAFRPTADERSKDGHISDRNGRSFPCLVITDAKKVRIEIPTELTHGTVAVDEPHLFQNRWLLPGLLMDLRDLGFNVFVSGLHLDLDGYALEPMKDLIWTADSVTELTSPCMIPECIGRAKYTFKNEDTLPTSGDVGLDKEYSVLCEYHFRQKYTVRMRERARRGRKYLDREGKFFIDER